MKLVMLCSNGITMKSICEALVSIPAINNKMEQCLLAVEELVNCTFSYNLKVDSEGYSVDSLKLEGLTKSIKSNAFQLLPDLETFTSVENDIENSEIAYLLLANRLVNYHNIEIELTDKLDVHNEILHCPQLSKLLANIPCQVNENTSEVICSIPALFFLFKHVSASTNKVQFSYGYHGKFVSQRSTLLEVSNPINSHRHEHIDNEMMILECNIDDCSSEILAFTMEKLFTSGANDVYYTPILMKKNRPAYKLSVLTTLEKKEKLESIIFHETTSLGVRSYPVSCHRLGRKFINVETEWGSVQVKIGIQNNKFVQISPEYNDCKKIAETNSISLQTVYDRAKQIASVQI